MTTHTNEERAIVTVGPANAAEWPADHEPGACGTTCVCACARCHTGGRCICPLDNGRMLDLLGVLRDLLPFAMDVNGAKCGTGDCSACRAHAKASAAIAKAEGR